MQRPAIEQAAAELRGSLTRLDAAGTQTDLAINHAERVQHRSRGTGFRGIAQGMARAVVMLRNLRAQVSALTPRVGKAAAAAHETGAAANPDHVKAKLAAAAHEVRAARTGIAAVVTNLAQVSSHIAAVLRGGQPGRLIAIVDGAKQAVMHAADHLGSAERKLTEAMNDANQIGAARAPGAGPPLGEPESVPFEPGGKGAWNRDLNKALRPDARYTQAEPGYTFDTDNAGRVKRVKGTLTAEAGQRNTYQQRVAGGQDRLSTDDGGHFFATIFRGPGERINLAPMDSNLNRGAWRALENTWAAALGRGEEVKVVIDIKYGPTGDRPVRFVIAYQIGNEPPRRSTFKNAPGGK